jgi:hypothetical protein
MTNISLRLEWCMNDDVEMCWWVFDIFLIFLRESDWINACLVGLVLVRCVVHGWERNSFAFQTGIYVCVLYVCVCVLHARVTRWVRWGCVEYVLRSMCKIFDSVPPSIFIWGSNALVHRMQCCVFGLVWLLWHGDLLNYELCFGCVCQFVCVSDG